MEFSALPLKALLYKLRAGFNTALSAAAATYQQEAYAIEFPDDIYSKNTLSFFRGKIHPEAIEAYGPSDATKMVMWVDVAQNQNNEKPRDFSGIVQVCLDVYLSWISNDPEQNMDSLSLMTEEAITDCIQGYTQQNWGPGVVYNGQFSCQRFAIQDVGQGSLQQLVSFKFVFQVDV
jgi:hypothetical protein